MAKKRKSKKAGVVSASAFMNQKAGGPAKSKKVKTANASRDVPTKSKADVSAIAQDTEKLGAGHTLLEKVPFQERGERFMEWFLNPVPPAQFREHFWERKPLLIARNPKTKRPKELCKKQPKPASAESVGGGASDDGVGREDEDEEEEEDEVDPRACSEHRCMCSIGPEDVWSYSTNCSFLDARQGAESKEADSDGGASYYKGWYHQDDLLSMIEQKGVRYGEDLNITRYIDGKRYTLDPSEVASIKTTKKFLKEGCSVRVLCPQRFSEPMWKMVSTFEDYWGYGAGANVYLTPKGTQGFAPHYDEIEAFIIQTEGSKKWRLYAPRSEQEWLDRVSSPNYSQEEIGEPIMEVTLHAGDMLYFPRGTIHQAASTASEHSLHVTVSTGLKNTWHDVIEKAFTSAISATSIINR